MKADTTASGLAEQLRAEIGEGLWAPGAALRQEELAARFGASRIPVREALQRLAAEGLLEIAPNRGAFVARLDRDQVEEIFDLRILLEGDLLARALPRHDARSLVRLSALQADLEMETARAGWLDGDRRFHEALYAPAGRAQTLRLAMTLRGQVERYALQDIGPETRRAAWKREHRALIAAVKAGDAAEAAAVLRRHLDETRAAVTRRLPSS